MTTTHAIAADIVGASNPAPPWGEPRLASFYREIMADDCLPPAPEIGVAIIAMLERETCKATEVAALVASDQSLAAALLRLSNSPFLGAAEPVTSIHQAVIHLGFARVRNLVLGLSTWKAFHGMGDTSRRYGLWNHSAMVGGVARVLAARAGRDGAAAFAAGILHDIGKLVLGLRLGKPYWALLTEAAARDVSVVELEEEAFGCTHGTVGGWLLKLWGLPSVLVEPASRHHEVLFPGCALDTPAIVSLADRLVHATNVRSGQAAPEVFTKVCGCAPGLLDCEEWHEIYNHLSEEQDAIRMLLAA